MQLGEGRANGDVHSLSMAECRSGFRQGNFCWRKLRVLTLDESEEAAQRGFKEKGLVSQCFVFFWTLWSGKAPGACPLTSVR